MEIHTDKKYTDHEVYLLIQQKNKAGFDYLYDQYGCIIYGLAIKAVQSKELADEVVELTFLNVWNSIHLFKLQQQTFFVWLVNILMKTSKSYLESKSIHYNIKTENFPEFTIERSGEQAC